MPREEDSVHVGLFCFRWRANAPPRSGMNEMKSTMAELVAKAAREFQHKRTGHEPQAVTVVLSGETLVITLHGALSPAEQALAKSAAGAAKVQEFHRQLFANSAESLREEIKRITGVDIRNISARHFADWLFVRGID